MSSTNTSLVTPHSPSSNPDFSTHRQLSCPDIMDDQAPRKRQKLDAGEQMSALEQPKEAPTLLTLPGEIRNLIYEYLYRDTKVNRRSRKLHRVFYHPTSTKTDPHQERGFGNLTRVCRDLRTEFLPFFLSRITIVVTLHTIESSIECFVQDLKKPNIKGSFHMRIFPHYFCKRKVDKNVKYELKSFLALAAQVPKLKSRMEISCWCRCDWCPEPPDFFDHDQQESFDLLSQLGRSNEHWARELTTKIDSVIFHPWTPMKLERRYPWERIDLAACLEIVYKKEHEASWMNRPHCFEELETYLEATGLTDLSSMDILVGQTSKRNMYCGTRFMRKSEAELAA